MTATSTRRGLKVALFATCANDVMFPQTPIATVELLERLGCRVEFPEEQTCCGQIFTNTGYYDEAMGSVKSYLKAFEKYEYIVGPSGSCVGSVRHQHEMLARRDAGDAIGDRDCYVLGDADTEQAQQPGQDDHDQDQVAEHQRGRRHLVAEPLHHAEQTLGLLSVLLGDCVCAHLGPLTSGRSSQGR